jgi:hypothetical protein
LEVPREGRGKRECKEEQKEGVRKERKREKMA